MQYNTELLVIYIILYSYLGHTKLMSWSSDFRSIILRGREFFLFLIIKKKFVVRSRKCLIHGGGNFANIFTQHSTLQGRCRGENVFLS